ncbi:DUF6512 family protein [Mediterraneibacter agrestimuris]|uniref:DUF6512 family protein n=1 Tax=Mediterraneibacter agrestimuris TaxID=2941333 RepID=UPI00203C1169|nr:DUF6512 family protein [Mediterraneibacter agrestimuris]
MNHLKKYTLWGILFVSVFGTLAHFIYEWSGKNPFLGLFFPVNESTWEHIKLLFFPMLVYLFYMQHKLKPWYPNMLHILFYGLLLGCALIPVLFYTYSGILGSTVIWIDIAIFYISVLISFFFIYQQICSKRRQFFSSSFKPKQAGPYLLVLLFTIAFFVFTFLPPDIGIFRSPV